MTTQKRGAGDCASVTHWYVAKIRNERRIGNSTITRSVWHSLMLIFPSTKEKSELGNGSIGYILPRRRRIRTIKRIVPIPPLGQYPQFLLCGHDGTAPINKITRITIRMMLILDLPFQPGVVSLNRVGALR